MALKADIKARAKGLYVHQAMDAVAIASELKISYDTVRRWKYAAAKTGDDWDLLRNASLLSGQGAEAVTATFLTRMAKHIEATFNAMDEQAARGAVNPVVNAEIISRITDSFSKMQNAIGKASPKFSKLAVASDVLHRLGQHLSQAKPELAPAFAAELEAFAATLAEAYG